MNDPAAANPQGPESDPPDEELGMFGDADDPGLTSDEDLDGEVDAGGLPDPHQH